MLMNFVWFALILLAFVSDAVTGAPFVSGNALLQGAKRGAELTLALAGPVCLWSGFARVMEASGASAALCRVMRPGLRRLFPQCARDETAFSCLCGNLAANLLGLGNAATPLGVRAVQRMRRLSGSDAATDEMCRFLVLNTSSLQLLPTTLASLRAQLGAAHAFDILPAVWLASAASACAGLLAARGFSLCWRD